MTGVPSPPLAWHRLDRDPTAVGAKQLGHRQAVPDATGTVAESPIRYPRTAERERWQAIRRKCSNDKGLGPSRPHLPLRVLYSLRSRKFCPANSGCR